MEHDELKRNIESVAERVRKASDRVGSKVTIVAATKTVPIETIGMLTEFGITDAGENRVQEYLSKREKVRGIDWHFIGTLQRNKAKYLVGSVKLIHSVSSVALAEEIDKLSKARGIITDVLAEVNAADEPDKTGAPTTEIDELIAKIGTLKNVRLRGIMAVPPIAAPTSVYKYVERLYAKYAGGTFDTLSVGMSGDFEKAIEYGSNLVRIGTAIFGARA